MTALVKARASSVREVTREPRPIAASGKGFKGGLAVVLLGGASQGYYQQAASGLTVPSAVVGRFYDDFDNTGGADGAISAQIDYFRERHLFLCVNDTAGTPLVVADRESPCNVLDDQTVTKAPELGNAGLVYDVTSEGVWVEIDHVTTSSLEAGATIRSGRTILAAGVSPAIPAPLTASSRIFMAHAIKNASTAAGELFALVTDRTTGSAGSFIVRALKADLTAETGDLSSVDWFVLN